MNTSIAAIISAILPLPANQMRYFISSEQRLLALISFSAAAWQTAPRDRFIGWTHEQRQRNLHVILNNSCFLILSWLNSHNLASKILALTAQRIPLEQLSRDNRGFAGFKVNNTNNISGVAAGIKAARTTYCEILPPVKYSERRPETGSLFLLKLGKISANHSNSTPIVEFMNE